MRFEALGPLVVVSGNQKVQLRPAQKRLLVSLLLTPNTPLSVDTLADRIWAEERPSNSHNTVHQHISGLRRHLPGVVETSGQSYILNLNGHELDVTEFTDLAARASRSLNKGRYGEAADLAESATRLWRGDPYPELYEIDAARGDRDRLREVLIGARTTQARALNLEGRIAESIAVLRLLVAEHPFNESLWGELVLAYYMAGRPADALTALKEARTKLGEELGIDLGPQLRDLEDRVLLHDPDLVAGTDPSVPTNLPVTDSSFIGREDDLSSVGFLLQRNHVVTITGAPGIGKTRLAIELGRTMLRTFPAGVWVATLASTRTPDDVLATIATAMSVTETVDSIPSLYRHIGQRPALLILDNCEHLVGALDSFLGARSYRDRLRVLATSRVRLGPTAEAVWPLQPLQVPDSVDRLWESETLRLFIDRVRASDPNVDLANADPRDLFEVCRKTGGMPLAVELTARWVPSVDLQTAATLTLRHSRIEPGSEPSHHNSVADAIARSMSLLSRSDQEAFAAASMFESAFTLEAYAKVCQRGSSTHAAETVSRLVGASLLVANHSSGRLRYTMLEPIKDFARSLLSSRRRASLRERHTGWFVGVARDLEIRTWTAAESEAVTQAAESLSDFRTAIRHLIDTGRPNDAVDVASGLARVWVRRFLTWEGHRWLHECLQHELDEPVRLRALCSAGEVSHFSGEAQDAVVYYQEALELALKRDDGWFIAKALQGMARTRVLFDPEEGYELYASVITPYEAVGATVEAANAQASIGIHLSRAGDPAARQPLLEAMERFRTADYPLGIGTCHRHLSLLACHLGEEWAARHHAGLAMEIGKSIDDNRLVAWTLTHVGMIEAIWGDPGAAAGHTLDGLDLIPWQHDGIISVVGSTVLPVLMAGGRWDEANTLMQHIDRLHERFGWIDPDRRFASISSARPLVAASMNARQGVPELTQTTTASVAAIVQATLKEIRGPANAAVQ